MVGLPLAYVEYVEVDHTHVDHTLVFIEIGQYYDAVI